MEIRPRVLRVRRHADLEANRRHLIHLQPVQIARQRLRRPTLRQVEMNVAGRDRKLAAVVEPRGAGERLSRIDVAPRLLQAHKAPGRLLCGPSRRINPGQQHDAEGVIRRFGKLLLLLAQVGEQL